MLNSWGYVYYYLGDMKAFINLFESHKDLVESLGDKERLGMFYVWLGTASHMAGQQKDSYDYLRSALELGEKSGAQKVAGYACAWLTWPCAYLGLFDEGITYGKRAQKIAESFPSDQYLFFKSLAGMSLNYGYQGNIKKLFEGTKRLLDYGEKTSNSRSKVFGHWINAWGHIFTGDMALCRKESEKAAGVALDPLYSQFPKATLAVSYFYDGQLQKAEDIIESSLDFCEKRGMGLLAAVQMFLSTIMIAKGNMKQGFKKFEETQEILLKNHMKVNYALSESILGMVYTQFITGSSPGFATLAKNIGFIVKNAPFADRKAQEHFNRAIEILREVGAKPSLGRVFFRLGQLHKAKRRNEQAREYFSEAVHLFQECDAHIYLKQAKEALFSL
jgi:tetratricopeptide (TPR) repeat protein